MSDRTDRPASPDSPTPEPDRTPRPSRIVAEPATIERCREDYESAAARQGREHGAPADRINGYS